MLILFYLLMTRTCWICYESEGDLVAPCRCSGTMRYVHRECIEEWLRVSQTTHCPNCRDEIADIEDPPLCIMSLCYMFIIGVIIYNSIVFID